MKATLAHLRVFFSGAWASYISHFAHIGLADYLAAQIALPFTYFLYFVLLGASANGWENVSFFVVGNALQIVSNNGIYGVTMGVGKERRNGTLSYLLSSPANNIVIFLGIAFFHILEGMFVIVLGFVWGVLFFGLDLASTNFLGLALAIVTAAVSTSGLGLLLGSLSLLSINIWLFNNVAYFLLLLLSGANVALSEFPRWVQTISYGLPLTRSIEAARASVEGATLPSIFSLLVGELLVGAIYALAGFALVSWLAMRSRRKDTVEAF